MFPAVPAQTQLKRGAGEGQRGSSLSLTMRLILFNWGQRKQVCTNWAWVKEFAPVKVGGPDLLPPKSPTTGMDLDSERAGLD